MAPVSWTMVIVLGAAVVVGLILLVAGRGGGDQ